MGFHDPKVVSSLEANGHIVNLPSLCILLSSHPRSLAVSRVAMCLSLDDRRRLDLPWATNTCVHEKQSELLLWGWTIGDRLYARLFPTFPT